MKILDFLSPSDGIISKHFKTAILTELTFNSLKENTLKDKILVSKQTALFLENSEIP